MKRALILWTLCAVAQPPAAAPADPARPAVVPESIERGAKGYGLSVFAGTEPERFEVEVLGVLRDSTPELSYILARLSGKDLERSGVVGGMSGSPVYFDGQLAGAVAFSYLFGLDAIAGITPIGAMRRLSELPQGQGAAVPMAAPPELLPGIDELAARDFPSDLLERQLARLAPPGVSGARSSLLWSASGFGEPAVSLLRQAVGDLVPAGVGAVYGQVAGSSSGGLAAADLVPGSAVAAVLVAGDLSLAGHGTLTERDGDEVLAFGHPMFSLGPVNMPLASSEVVTVVANAFNSFKVSNAGEVIGAFDQDREAGVRGKLGAAAPTTPLAVRLRGLAERDYRMEIADLPPLRPILIAISTLGAISSATYAGGTQGLDLEARIAIAGHDDLLVRQSFDGDQAAIDSVIHLLSFAAFLEFTPLAEVEMTSVDVELTQVDRPRSATLLAAHAGRTRVEPGQTVPVSLELQAYRGERFRREVSVEVPAGAPDGRYVVLIGDGTSMDAARLALEQRRPTSFEQALRLLKSFHSRRELSVFGLVPGPGMAVAGETLPSLPGSVRSIFAAAGTPPGVPLAFEIAYESVTELERPVDGVLRLDLEVRRPRK